MDKRIKKYLDDAPSIMKAMSDYIEELENKNQNLLNTVNELKDCIRDLNQLLYDEPNKAK